MNIEQIKTLLEIGYYSAGIVICIVSIIGLNQLNLLKHDILIRNQRAAAEKAIEYNVRFTTICIPLINAWDKWRIDNQIPSYSGSIGKFSFDELTIEQKKTTLNRVHSETWTPVFNELGVIADAFLSGVADEKIGFQSFGICYCKTIESMYDTLCFAYSDEVLPELPVTPLQ